MTRKNYTKALESMQSTLESETKSKVQCYYFFSLENRLYLKKFFILSVMPELYYPTPYSKRHKHELTKFLYSAKCESCVLYIGSIRIEPT